MCLGGALCGAAGAQGVDDLGVLGKAFLGVLGEDEVAVRDDVEHTVGPFDQLGVDAERVLDGGRQTGGLGQVLSTGAVGNRQRHSDPPDASILRPARCGVDRF